MDPLRRNLTNPRIERLLKVMEAFRLLDREMPASLTSCFLYVASHDNCHKQALEEDLVMKTSSTSRNTDWLSKYHRLKKPGLHLITKEADPANRRRQVLKLSPKGEQLVKLIEELLYD
ncbi:MAG: winged helix-turn-helix transcriptional regulator [Ignavibacteria bacterium]|nr:winged helix-turn-helix transcriptional regulator [Ignavibacteria bacterium]